MTKISESYKNLLLEMFNRYLNSDCIEDIKMQENCNPEITRNGMGEICDIMGSRSLSILIRISK